MSDTGGIWMKLKLVLHVLLWSVLLTAAAVWLTVFLFGTLREPWDKKRARSSSDNFDSVVALTEQKVVRYLGEWELSEPKLPGHYHHVGRWYQADNWNFCVRCHGAIPHSRSPQIRAFLNMHNLFITCQVCHVQEFDGVRPTRFGWVSLSDGQLCPNPDMTQGSWGEYGAKIIPLKEGTDEPEALHLKGEEAFAKQFQHHFNSLNDSQKAKGNKFIHRRCTETAVRCYDCHNTQTAYLPYTDLGFTTERAEFLVSTEVADLVARYETFYLPNLLKPSNGAPPDTDPNQVDSP